MKRLFLLLSLAARAAFGQSASTPPASTTAPMVCNGSICTVGTTVLDPVNGISGPVVAVFNGNATSFIGDSLTAAGSNWSIPLGGIAANVTDAWPTQAAILSNAQVKYVGNVGIGGQTCAQMAARFAVDVVAQHPAKVNILCGTNDAIQGIQGASAASTISYIAAMVQQSKTAGITPILNLIPPNSNGFHAAITQINARIQALAASQGLTLVDFYSPMVDATTGNYKAGYSSDGTHPIDAAHRRLLAQAWVTATAGIYRNWKPYLVSTAGDTLNLITVNPLFLSTGGIFPFFGSAGGTSQFVPDAAIAGRWYQLTRIASPGGLDGAVLTELSSGFAPGDRLLLSGKIKTTGVESGGLSFDVGMTFFTAGNAYVSDVFPLNAYGADITDGTFYIECTVPPTATQVQVKLLSHSGTGVIQFAQVGLINLTANGL